MVRRFDQGAAELSERVGHGKLVGSLYRNQRYAAVQERDPTLLHPAGGTWKYQEGALYAMHRAALARTAATVLSPQGPAAGLEAGLEMVDTMASALAPKEHLVLAKSGHIRVYDAGALVRERRPKAPRLTDAQLRARHRRRGSGRGRRGGGRRGR